ncbi:type I polyketide synthase [Streptomyces sp. NBC_00162]|uniref:type I polyketide synthase n=1 Tax=Streptomyces sp. NBC_00162 TaxID=2903629 RepID=UPI00214AF2C1|nr:type I polyketide synthase [Streptomyces sp. NBC_00162]UUU39568.1 SDR family NAD(P)-dependent oxidoreductase [Streptomyces sp. NBC_00162]
MSASYEKVVEALRKSLEEVGSLKKQNRQLVGASREPIAIVGMACRLPGGVAGPEDLWGLVSEGRDAMSSFPDDRGWDLEGLFDPDPDHAGTSYTSMGGFLHEAPQFDAGFFGISPREALAMDPQQRLLLETSWEALEAAGINPVSLKGTDVGVFSGTSTQGYGAGSDAPEAEGFGVTGTLSSVASGRVSYVLGLEGPAVTVDTACSSSLVAMHLAAQALRQGECSMALAGGATVMATPGAFVEFSRQRGLAADGRCKAFSAAADGTGWAEGVGVVVLERLSVARERGHRVLAVLRGSAVNQDGASNGLTAPNGPSQQRVIRKALTGAGLSPSDVDVVEAHGTGTTLGDPIEAQALLATYGRDREPEQPLWLGSLKSNIGHTQAAAGVAGVIKMVQALRHGVLPATLHVDAPTPQVDWSAGAVELLTESREWPQNGRPRRAGVSAFGVSGTNAHLILEEAPAEEAESASAESAPAGVVPLVVSARSAGSLAGQAKRLVAFVEGADGVSPAEVAGALVSDRALLGERAVVVAGSNEEALAGLQALARGESAAGVVSGSAAGSSKPGKIVWVFPGQGSQWAGMGRELLESSPVFAERIAECAAALERWVDWSLIDVLRGETAPELMERVDVLQPASFAVMVGLAAVWESVGIKADAVLGHSQGEIAAACVAGALSLQDAARVVALRSQAIAKDLAGRGGMASVALSEDEAVARIQPWADRVEVAAVNGPSSVVVAGDAQALDEALEALSAEGVRVRRVAVDYASHTRHVEDIRDALAETLAEVSALAPKVPFYSTVTGTWVEEADVLDGEYWYRNLRGQVGFGPAVVKLLEQGHGVFVEVSAHPVLVQPITETVDNTETGTNVVVTGSLRREDGGLRRLLASMAELFVRGIALDWSGVLPQTPSSRRVELPTYAFDHQHYWLQPGESATDAASLGQATADHPLLGAVVRLPQSDGLVFTSRLSLRTHPWLADHAIGGVVLLPGTGLLELAVRAGDEAGCGVLEELVIEAPLVVPEHGGVRIQVAVGGPGVNGSRTVEVYSQREDAVDEGGAETWTRHATGMLAAAPATGTGQAFDFAAWPPAGAQPVEVGDFYADLEERGFGYGPAFQGLRAVWRRGEEVFAEVALPEEQRKEADKFGLHPALLDAALQAGTFASAAGTEGEEPGEAVLAFAWNGLELHAVGASALRVRVAPVGPDALSVEAADETGGLVVTLDSVVSRAVSAEQLETAADAAVADSLFGVEWTELSPAEVTEPSPWWMPVATADDVADLAESAGAPAVVVLEAVGGDGEDAVLALSSRVLEILQTWLDGAGLEESQLVVVTRGAVPAGADGAVSDPAGSAVWGLVRAAQAENPDRIVLIDADPAAEGDVEPVLGAVLASGEPQVAVRGTALSVPRLVRAGGEVPDAPAVFGPEGTVLVTGATGALGALVARHLVTRHGVRSLVLASRRGADAEGAQDLVAELTEQGAAVSLVACDVSDRDQVEALLASVPAEHRLTGVVHTAGVFDDGVIGALTPERLAGVFAPKVDAVRHLDELTRDLDLDAFVVYSSVAGVFGGGAQGNYAAANAFLDGLMSRRRAAGLPGLSLAWGLWERTLGMAANLSSVDQARASRSGVLEITADEGLDLFDAGLHAGRALLVPIKLDLRTLRAQAGAGGGVPHLLRGLVRAGRQVARAVAATDGGLAGRLAGLTGAEQETLLLDVVRAQAAVVLGHAGPEGVRAEMAFKDVGFDSLTSVELRNRLREATGLKLPATLVFDYPTPLALSRYLREEFGDVAPAPAARAAVVADAGEPLAIVGMACRLPGGVTGPEDLWRLVSEGRDAVSSFPDDRGWDLEGLFDSDPDSAGTSYTSKGGFLHDAGQFDAGFFGISPREALAMDPQQRLLLETSWEALEGAGIDPVSLKGTDVGVFSGVSGQGYGVGADAPELEGFAVTGSVSSVASGRVSYVLGLEGPAVTVDTACSSSLVAMHLAAQALRQGECSMALAGGAMVMASPGGFTAFSRQRGLATDGRCKAYADGADGTVLSEGVGVVLLERLSVARERGHRVLAVLRGSAVNQDGASNGLTAPNGPSQQRVIRRALDSAGLSPSDVDVVEGHGTGTALGDPIEAQALLATYGRDRDAERPLWLGSLKSNIGHSQAAAGVAGVIKMVQALRHGVMPPTLHVEEPTTQVDWSEGAIELLTEAREWPQNGHPRRAGVSSFGISGTNAHLILEEAPAEPADRVSEEQAPAGVLPLVVSARSAGSLAGQAGRLAAFVEGADGVSLADVAGALVSDRTAFGERAVILADSAEEALPGLRALAQGENAPGVVIGSAGTGAPGKVVWVFPGQGSQWAGMGRELLESSPVFAERIAECAAALDPWVDWSLLAVLRGQTAPELMERVDVLQPASFAVMVGLAAVWSSVGVEPDAVLGHSQGEIAAACVAGALSLQDAARVVALRSQAIAKDLAGRGGMASVALSEDEAVTRIQPWADRVEVAAVNGPSSVVIAGDAEALDEALEALSGEGVRVRRVAVDYASHTRHVEDIREKLAEALAGVIALAPKVPFYSTVTGTWVEDSDVLDGEYWYRNLRGQVGFGPAVAGLLEQGHGVFVEVSAHPVLVQPISETVDDRHADVVVTGSLRREDGGLRRLLASMAELFVRGVAVDWNGVLPQTAESRRVELPTYAFDHQHYWLQPGESATDAASLGLSGADHPLLGAVVRLPQSDGLVFTSRLSLRTHSWLADHAIGGVVLLPGTGLLELAVRAGDEAGCGVLEELVIEAPLVVPEHGGVRIQVAVGGPGANGSRTVEVYSQREDAVSEGGADVWTRHATGTLSAAAHAGGTGFDFAAWPPAGAQPVESGNLYTDLAESGFGYGPAFQGVRAVWRRGDEVFAEVVLPEELRKEAGKFGLHPALLDAALQAGTFGAAAGAAEDESREPVLAFAWNGLVLHAAGASALRVRVAPCGPDALSVEAADATGALVVTMDSLVSRPVSVEQLDAAAADDSRSYMFGVEWTELSPAEGLEPSPWWVPVASADDVAALADDAASGLGVPAAAVLDAVGGDGEDAVLALSSRVLEVVQAWLAGTGLEESRLVVLTRGAVPAGDGTVTDPAGSAVWGLVRAAQSENPDRIVLLDTDPAADGNVELVLGAVLASGEPQVAVRGTALSVPRLVRAGDEVADGPAVFGPEGTVLVSGAGSLGALAARHLVTRQGVRHLMLASRKGPDADGVADLVAELTEQGATVSVVACDVSDRDQVEALLASVPAEHRLTGVVHTAGVFDAGVIGALTPERLAKVYAPKVNAVQHLDELTRGMDLDAFIVYSSASSVFMGAGSGGYAAANAFLDGLMAHRRGAGLPGLSLAWGPWDTATNLGDTIDDLTKAQMSRREGRGGITALKPAEGMELFGAAVGSGQALLVPVKLDLKGARADAAASGGVPYLLRGLVRVGRQQAQAAAATGEERRSLSDRLAGLGAAEQEALLLDLVRAQVAVVLGHSDPGSVRAEMAFKDAGFDSLTSVELRNRVREVTGLKLPATLVFDYPTPLTLARHLREECGVEEASAADPVLAGLAGLETAIESAASDEEARERITVRLRELLKAAEAAGGPDGAAGTADTSDEDLDSASDEDLFAIFDRLD